MDIIECIFVFSLYFPCNLRSRSINIFEERENTDNETIISSFNSIFDTELRFNDQWKLSSQVGIKRVILTPGTLPFSLE